MKAVIGRSSPSASAPNTTELFRFNLEPGTSRVAPFDIVVAHSEDQGDTFGIVTEITQTGSEASTAVANVLWSSAGSSSPIAGHAPVTFPDLDGIHRALGITDIPEERRIPAGLIEQSDGTRAVAFLDRELVLGPTAGHVSISGLAPRTPYVSFLLESFKKIPRAHHYFVGVDIKNRELLNTLNAHEVTEDRIKLCKLLGLDLDSWSKNAVLVFPPKIEEDYGLPVYSYDLKYTAPKLDLVFAKIPVSDRLLAPLIDEIARGIQNLGDNAWIQVQRWSDLWSKPPLVQQGIPQSFRGVTAREVSRFLNLLRRRITAKNSGIFVDNIESDTMTIKRIVTSLPQNVNAALVDVFRLYLEEQYLVIGDMLREGFEFRADPQNMFKRDILFFLDDLDRFAGSWIEPTDPVLGELFEIVERGPGLGMILIGAQQSISDLHPRLAAKFTTRLFGRGAGGAVDPAIGELLAPGLRGQLSRLEPDQLILTHPVYRHPVKIRYPRFT